MNETKPRRSAYKRKERSDKGATRTFRLPDDYRRYVARVRALKSNPVPLEQFLEYKDWSCHICGDKGQCFPEPVFHIMPFAVCPCCYEAGKAIGHDKIMEWVERVVEYQVRESLEGIVL